MLVVSSLLCDIKQIDYELEISFTARQIYGQAYRQTDRQADRKKDE